jgi:hypothetical protein
MFRDFINGCCTLTIAGMSLNTYLNHGHNFPTLMSIILAALATTISFGAAARHQLSPAAR